MAEKKRIKKGIMGGTFDPIHIGHLILGENAYLQFGLDSVLFMPSGNPPHKRGRTGRASTQERVDMVRLAIADNPHFELSLIETHDQGYTYTKETLLRLRNAGKVLCVATSKPEPFARAIADRFGLAECFDFVGGASLDDTRTKKAAVIEYVLASVGSPEPEQVLMVGDRRHDVEGAAAFGIDCLGVLYGYGSREELTAAGACFLAEQPADIADYVLGK